MNVAIYLLLSRLLFASRSKYSRGSVLYSSVTFGGQRCDSDGISFLRPLVNSSAYHLRFRHFHFSLLRKSFFESNLDPSFILSNAIMLPASRSDINLHFSGFESTFLYTILLSTFHSLSRKPWIIVKSHYTPNNNKTTPAFYITNNPIISMITINPEQFNRFMPLPCNHR